MINLAIICSQSLQQTAVRETCLQFAALVLLLFLMIGNTMAFLYSSGTTPLMMEYWKNLTRGLLKGSANSFRTIGDILSGPEALWD